MMIKFIKKILSWFGRGILGQLEDEHMRLNSIR